MLTAQSVPTKLSFAALPMMDNVDISEGDLRAELSVWLEPGSPWNNGFIGPLTPGSAMNCSIVRSSTLSPKPGSSWRAGGASTTPCTRTGRWPTSRRRRRSSFQRTPSGRLRHPGRLRRPRWFNERTYTDFVSGPPGGGPINAMMRITSFPMDCADDACDPVNLLQPPPIALSEYMHEAQRPVCHQLLRW